MITKTAETQNYKIKMTLTREAMDKVADLDGYRIKTGTTAFENYDVEITNKAIGKTIYAHGKPNGFAFFDANLKGYKNLPAGAYARIGDYYVGKETYDLAQQLIAALDAEAKSEEYEAAKAAEIAAKKIEDETIDTEAKEYAAQIKSGLCPRCHTYCYGDCTAHN